MFHEQVSNLLGPQTPKPEKAIFQHLADEIQAINGYDRNLEGTIPSAWSQLTSLKVKMRSFRKDGSVLFCWGCGRSCTVDAALSHTLGPC